jgi:molybdopterin/thiamine biosynthesis adenylyltransferase
LGTEGQEKIKKVHVAIIGLGGLGSHVAQGLAFLGVEKFVLIDDDKVSLTNLNRLIGATPEDAQKSELKTTVAERMIHKINPNCNVCAIPKNLRTKEAIDAVISSGITFGCVDQDGPRLILMELAASYRKTYIDLATEIIVGDKKIKDFGGRIVISRPGDFCLDCSNQLDKEIAKQELESESVQELRRAHGYGLGEEIPAPAVVSLNGIIANLAITEFLFMITGIREPFRHIIYYGLRGKVANVFER